MIIVSVLNFKGGTGKSSTVENVGYALTLEGYEVLIIDGDRQCNSTHTLLSREGTGPTLADVMTSKEPLAKAIQKSREHLFVVPGDPNLEKVSTYLKEHRRAYYTMQRELKNLQQHFDFVIIDHPGAYSSVMEALLLASTDILIPCELEPYSVEGLFDMFAKLEEELEDHKLRNLGIVPYNTNYSRKMTSQYMDELKQEFGDIILAPISTDINVSYAQSKAMTLFEYEAAEKVKSKAAADFRVLARHISSMTKENVA